MLRLCKKCKQTKEISLFANCGVTKGIQYYAHLCSECKNYATRERNWNRMGIVGATLQLFEERLKQQAYKCAICSCDISISATLDHCHVSGNVRGILCNKCNAGLGMFNDELEHIRKAVLYLEKWKINA